MTVAIRPASTMVLCKITTKWPHKILLVKRSAQSSFLPGAHVFPGGALEESDEEFGRFLARDLLQQEKMGDQGLYPFLAAAIRETLEETGFAILKLKNEEGLGPEALMSLINSPKESQWLKAVPALEQIWPISWWITPFGEVRRFDTRFFFALDDLPLIPPAISPEIEAHNAVWFAPNEALTAYEQGEIFLAPPTRSIIERMAATKSLEEFLSFVDRPLWPIEPLFAQEADKKLLVLPGDPLHPKSQPSALPLHTRYLFP